MDKFNDFSDRLRNSVINAYCAGLPCFYMDEDFQKLIEETDRLLEERLKELQNTEEIEGGFCPAE